MADPGDPAQPTEHDRGVGAWLYRHAYLFAFVAVTALVIATWLHRAPKPQAAAARTDGG